ncbi:MAG TPA: menaquinone biosynthesis protein [Bryobacteraceae bacterium]|nr:menaquinone biosynthesis protein [Bryobacteraceae bacterium]
MCAVSYLNTVPLVWGFLKGPLRDEFDLSFALPSECAEQVRRGEADIGIVPVVELPSLGLEIIRGTGIACGGPVRSILLVSKKPPATIRTLAADKASRTSVALAQIVLEQRYGAEPEVLPEPANLDRMLATADAALIIGDPALRLDPAALPYIVLDLGAEWVNMTGLPMVFAAWAGRREIVTRDLEAVFADSYAYGREHIAEIAREAEQRGIPASVAAHYLTDHIVFELGEREYAGMELFLSHASRLRTLDVTGVRSL